MAKITTQQLGTMFPTLNDLFAAITSGELDEYGDQIDWSELPIYADPEWDNPMEVWSWDETRAIVGDCSEEMRIIDRSELI